jgi:hypothetical protein
MSPLPLCQHTLMSSTNAPRSCHAILYSYRPNSCPHYHGVFVPFSLRYLPESAPPFQPGPLLCLRYPLGQKSHVTVFIVCRRVFCVRDLNHLQTVELMSIC